MMKFFNVVLTLVLCSSLWAQTTQSTYKLLLGRWITEEDKNSKLLFDSNFVYQTYEGYSPDTFRYFFLDKYAHTKGDFLQLVNVGGKDTLTFEIMGLTSKSLSLLDVQSTGKIWLLKRY